MIQCPQHAGRKTRNEVSVMPKKPTNIQIIDATKCIDSIQVPKINAHLQARGYHPIDKARRDRVLKPKPTGENNHPSKKKAPTRGGKRANTGGARKGSGRKLGAATKRTRQIADDLAKDPTRISPLDYMLDTLNETPDQLAEDLKSKKINSEEFVLRMKMNIERRDQAAKDAAPYIHPRLSSIAATITVTGMDAFVLAREARLRNKK